MIDKDRANKTEVQSEKSDVKTMAELPNTEHLTSPDEIKEERPEDIVKETRANLITKGHVKAEELIAVRKQDIANGMPKSHLKGIISDLELILYKNYDDSYDLRNEFYPGWPDADLEYYLNGLKKLLYPDINPKVEEAIVARRRDLSQGMSMDDLDDIENRVEAILYENDPEGLRDKLYPGWSNIDLEYYMRGMENL